MIFRLGELFCGPGGLAWGAMNADIGNPDFGIVKDACTLAIKDSTSWVELLKIFSSILDDASSGN